MNNPISPEQALEIAKEVGICVTQAKNLGHAMVLDDREVFLSTREEFQDAMNLSITKYFGEPVAEVTLWSEYLGGEKPRELYELKQLPAIHKLPHGTISLYARKEGK